MGEVLQIRSSDENIQKNIIQFILWCIKRRI
jgi:hypothetical protein